MGEQAPALEILKYRRRQVADQVEAVQLVDDDDCDWEAIATWCGGSLVNHEVADSGEYETRLILGDNHHGRRTGFAGEWVVTDGSGFFWLLLEDTFAETYEAGEAPPGTLQERIDGLAKALANATEIIGDQNAEIARLTRKLNAATKQRRHPVSSGDDRGPALAQLPASAEDGAGLIAAERRRQVESEGRTPEHDAGEHDPGDLARAARAYLTSAILHLARPDLAAAGDGVSAWPFERSGFKPGPTPLRTLVKAGALVAAEIDREMARQRAEGRDTARQSAGTGSGRGDESRGPHAAAQGRAGGGSP